MNILSILIVRYFTLWNCIIIWWSYIFILRSHLNIWFFKYWWPVVFLKFFFLDLICLLYLRLLSSVNTSSWHIPCHQMPIRSNYHLIICIYRKTCSIKFINSWFVLMRLIILIQFLVLHVKSWNLLNFLVIFIKFFKRQLVWACNFTLLFIIILSNFWSISCFIFSNCVCQNILKSFKLLCIVK